MSLYIWNHQLLYCCSDKRGLLMFDTPSDSFINELLTGWWKLIIDWSPNLTHQYKDFSVVPVRCRNWCHFKHNRPWVGSREESWWCVSSVTKLLVQRRDISSIIQFTIHISHNIWSGFCWVDPTDQWRSWNPDIADWISSYECYEVAQVSSFCFLTTINNSW